MTKVILHGCNGHMGRVINDLIKSDPDVEITAGVDVNTEIVNTYPVFSNIEECDINADVIIDFSTAKAVDKLIDYSEGKGIPLVLCTTGLTDEQIQKVKKASESVAILKSANMSLGVNTLMKLLGEATSILADRGFDIEIVEQHHNRKLDAPSGTALALADAVNEAADGRYEYIYDRSTRKQSRDSMELGISAVRGGTIVGTHSVIFAGTDEVIEIKHTAYSRAIFAKGSIDAAKYLSGRGPGLYDMSDVIKN